MANNPKPKLPIQVIFAMILMVATIFAIVIAIVPTALPVIVKPTLTAIPVITTATQPIVTEQLFTQRLVIPTNTPTLNVTSTTAPTNTPAATATPTFTSTPQPLPDLIVTGISDPICTKDQRVTPEKLYVKFSFIVRNIGPGSTGSFGPFSIRVNLILGQHHYSLEEWASGFQGVIGSSNMDIANLDPSGDVELNVSIDLKGNTSFGVEVNANSGPYTIPESNTANNSFVQGFSVICK